MSDLIKNFVFFANDSSQINNDDNNIINVRTIIDPNNEPYFVAKDIAKALGYEDTDQAIRKNCFNPITCKEVLDSLQFLGKTLLPDGIEIFIKNNSLQMQTKLIREPDVYALIFRSKLESAKRFQLWVFEEVLPSIRKTGKYSINNQFNGNDLAEISKSIVLLLEENITIKKQLSFVIDELIGLKPKAETLEKGKGMPMLPPAHIDAMASRYAVKIFLAHLQKCWWEFTYTSPAPTPWVINKYPNQHHKNIDPEQVIPTDHPAYKKRTAPPTSFPGRTIPRPQKINPSAIAKAIANENKGN